MSFSFMVWEMPLTTLTDHRLRVTSFTLAAAAILTACSNCFSPLSRASGSSSSTTLSAVSGEGAPGVRNMRAKLTSGLTLSGLERAMSRRSLASTGMATSDLPLSAIFRAMFSVVNELITQVTRMNIMVPLSTSSPKRCWPSGRMIW